MLDATAFPQPSAVPILDAMTVDPTQRNPWVVPDPTSAWPSGNQPARNLTGAAPTEPTEILFVDATVPDADRLLLGLEPTVEVVRLAGDRDGIDQISGELAQRQGITAVHLLGHGAAGRIPLGNRELNAQTLSAQGDRLTDWANALTDDADLLIYGCDVASTDDGRTLLDLLAGRTGADVAASDDLTGSAGQGGDWDLEWRSGAIETDLPFDPAARDTYAHTLATITVTTTLDAVGTGPEISLREAIIEANSTAEADTIIVPAGNYVLQSGVGFGPLNIDGPGTVTIIGAGSSQTLIDGTQLGAANQKVIDIGSDAIFDQVAITGGRGGNGGGIFSDDANLRIRNSALYGNEATSGGAIYHNGGLLELTNTLIYNNTAAPGGAGIALDGSTVVIQDSTIVSNAGGGIVGDDATVLAIRNSSISDNKLGSGILINNAAPVAAPDRITVTSSTISGNKEDGIQSTGNPLPVTISSSTLANNGRNALNLNGGTVALTNSTLANNGGNALNLTGGAVTLTNSTLANNIGGILIGGGTASLTINNSLFANSSFEVGGGSVTGRNNLLRNNSTAFDPSTNLLGVDPQIGALADNGGPTQTMALLTGSPAIDAGNSALAPTSTDQRGLTRIVGSAVDIGAYEVQDIPPPTFGDIQVIDLDNGDVLIPDNTSTPVFVGLGEPGEIVERNLQIRNLGNGNLAIAQPVVPTGFSLTTPLFPNIIEPGASLPLTFRLDTSQPGGKYGFFSFANNDTDSNPYNFPLFGITFLPFDRYSLTLERPPFPAPNLTTATLTAAPSSHAVTGRQGDESLIGSDDAEVLIGFGGNDNLTGNGGHDNLYGLQGNDYMDGGDGDDNLAGGSGDDAMLGGAGLDAIAGSSGNDRADGGLDADQLSGDAGDDFLDGGDGDDAIAGGADNDALLGAAGNDAIAGSTGFDSIVGEAGDDDLDGGDDDDILSGDAGNDVVLGGQGLDTVIGGDGDDILDGGEGDDILQGDEGSDRFVIAPVPGTKFIVDFTAGVDVFQLTGGLTFADLTISRNDLGQTEIRLGSQLLAVLQRRAALTASDFIEAIA